MAHILGIVGSARRWGNSELLVRQALRGAQAEGATASLLRLTDLHLEACTGCLGCAIGSKPCRVKDDMPWLVETIQAAQGLVLAAPTYFLGLAATVKQVLDRMLMVTGRVDEALPAARPAVTIATAGLENWRGVTLPYLNALVSAFGYRVIESLTAVAPGPGEVLLDEQVMARVLDAGLRLGRGDLEPTPAPPNVCPVCRCDSFMLDGDRVTCPICGLAASIEQEGDGLQLRFDPVDGNQHRWTPEALRRHTIDWVIATGPRFLAHRPEIKARRQPYRQMEVDWLRPAPPDASRKSGP